MPERLACWQYCSRREQLLYALSLDYAESARRSPHLLVLGSLLEGFRPQPLGGPDKRARFESLYLCSYDGWPPAYDEWFGPSRMRPLAASGGVVGVTLPPPSDELAK